MKSRNVNLEHIYLRLTLESLPFFAPKRNWCPVGIDVLNPLGLELNRFDKGLRIGMRNQTLN
jgi:hypothetical protein